MPPRKKTAKKPVTANNDASLDFEATLWKAADKLRSNMDAAVYTRNPPDRWWTSPRGRWGSPIAPRP